MEEPIKASLLTLPEELLRHLIRMVDWQDSRTALRMRYNARAILLQGVREDYGVLYRRKPVNGLSALSRTCHKMRILCSPLRFKTVTSKQFFHATFRRRIALVHANHIRTLAITHVQGVDMDDIVYAASSLPALDRLVIHAAALRIPLPISEDPEPLFGEEAEAYLSVLGGVLSRLKVLELVGFSAITPLVTILLRSTNISFLKIYKYRAPELSDSEAASSAIALSQALQGLKKISTLLLYDATPLLRFLADNNQLDQWTSRLSLKAFYYQFQLDNDYNEEVSDADEDVEAVTLMQFLKPLAPELLKLNFNLGVRQYFTSFLDIFQQPYPKLREFALRGDFSDTFPFRSLSDSSSGPVDFPNVRKLEIRPQIDENLPLPASVPHPSKLLPHFPSLRTLYYHLQPSDFSHFPGVPLKTLTEYRLYCQERGIALQGLKWDPFNQHYTDRMDYGEDVGLVGKESYVETRGKEIQRILDFAGRVKDRACLTLDDTLIDRLVLSLEPIKLMEELELD